ncbi:MAG: DUF2867 domain-containing protein [Massilia sp.]
MPRQITPIAVPPLSYIAQQLAGAYFSDAYEVALENDDKTALEIYLQSAARPPRWVNACMALRNRVVALVGLKNLGHLHALAGGKAAGDYRPGDRVGIFSLLSVTDDEVILGDSDKHLDVKVSVCKITRGTQHSVAFSTVVHIHNLLGRVYMLFITPMHKLIVRAVLRQV